MEKIDINQDVINLISKISEGSVRDALSLLDRISLTNDDSQKGSISLESAREIFGYFDKEFTINLIEKIFDGDEDKTLDLYRQIYQKGIEPKIFLNGFLEIVYYLKNFKNLERVSFSTDLTENNFTKIKEMSEKLDAHTLLLFWQFAIETMDEVNIVNDPNLSVEMFLIRLLYLKGNQTKTDNPALNQNNKIENNFEKKKIAVNQLKSSSQEKQKKILEENKSLNNLEIKSFNDLVDICNSKKEVELKYELETNVNLINFKNGYIEISFNENLKKDFVKMGSYGIGVSRLVGAIIEAKYDDKNEIMKWPLSVAPYDIALIPMINKNDTSALDKANNINIELLKNNIDAIIDDTDENFSSKIKKMNLIGAPYQIIIGKKSEGDLLEFKETGGETQNLPLSKIIEIITKQKNSI